MKRLGFDLILLGDPTSGKDTQADLLSKKFSVKTARSGAYLRHLKKISKKYKKILERTVDKGQPAPTKIVERFLKESVSKAMGKDLIFVGTPRLVNEARSLTSFLEKQKRNYQVLYLKLPKKEVLKRSYLRQREKNDLDSKYIQIRINYHSRLVNKTVKFYQARKKLKFINGNQSIAGVAEDIKKALDDHKRSKRN